MALVSRSYSLWHRGRRHSDRLPLRSPWPASRRALKKSMEAPGGSIPAAIVTPAAYMPPNPWSRRPPSRPFTESVLRHLRHTCKVYIGSVRVRLCSIPPVPCLCLFRSHLKRIPKNIPEGTMTLPSCVKPLTMRPGVAGVQKAHCHSLLFYVPYVCVYALHIIVQLRSVACYWPGIHWLS